MKYKKRIFISCSLIIAILLFLYFRPVEIDKEYDSIIYSTDDGFEHSTKIKLTGELYRNPFGNSTMSGDLTVDGDLNYKVKLKYDKSSDNYFYTMIDWDDMKNHRTLGTIYTSSNLDKVWISLKAIDERYQIKESYVSGPANSLEEGNALAKELMSPK